MDLSRGREAAREALDSFADIPTAISGISVEELFAGAGYILQKKGDSHFRVIKQQTEKILEEFLIFEVTRSILEQSGINRGKLLAQGISIAPTDIIIATTAQYYGASHILTRNQRHFEWAGLPLETYSL